MSTLTLYTKKQLLFWIALVALIAPVTLVDAHHPTTELNASSYVEGQIVVKIDVANNVTIDEINADYETSTIEAVLESAGIYLLATELQPQAAVATLGKDARVLYAELNYIIETPEANPMGSWAFSGDDLMVATEANPMGSWAFGGEESTHLASQYALDMINAGATSATGSGVTVAVLDTGVEAAHPMLAGAVVGGYDFIDDDSNSAEIFNGLDDDGDGMIDEAAGHGTHVAGIVRLVAPDATIMPVRVLDSDGRGSVFLLAEAIAFAADNGADVINMSLGITFRSRLLEDVVASTLESGVLIIAAAGNSGTDTMQYPAAFDGVVSVTAVNEASEQLDFANYGWWVDIAAPGQSIYSAFPGGNFAWWSGTSMASPFVAGVVALMVEAAPDADNNTLAGQLVGDEWDSNRRDAASAEFIPLLDVESALAPN